MIKSQHLLFNIIRENNILECTESEKPTFANVLASICFKENKEYTTSSRVQDLIVSVSEEMGQGIKKTGDSYRINCAFSFGVLAGKASRKRIVEIKMLSK